MPRRKKLGYKVVCPGCKTSVEPLLIEFVQGRTHSGSHGFSIPDRNFLECQSCGAEFYKPVVQ